jgi:hypothetical protein
MTIHQMLTELQTWFNPSQELLTKAKQSKITTKNNAIFKQLVDGWMEGMFDEDPRLMYDEITFLLK